MEIEELYTAMIMMHLLKDKITQLLETLPLDQDVRWTFFAGSNIGLSLIFSKQYCANIQCVWPTNEGEFDRLFKKIESAKKKRFRDSQSSIVNCSRAQ